MPLRMTYGPAPDGQKIAIITKGGHPLIDNRNCTILAVEAMPTRKAAKKWFNKMKVERPWETRQ